MNSIYWGNDDISGDVTVSYSNVMGGYDGTANFNGRPGFVDADNDDLTLADWSPMIGRGDLDDIVEYDIAGISRASGANFRLPQTVRGACQMATAYRHRAPVAVFPRKYLRAMAPLS